MPVPPTTNTLRAVLNITSNGQICNNILHYQIPLGVTAADMTDLGTGLGATWTSAIRALVPTTCVLTSIDVIDLGENPQASVNVIKSTGGTGTNVSPAMPNNVTCVATLRTAKRGRSFRGRIYHVGLTEADVTGDSLVPGTAASLESGYSQFRNVTLASSGKVAGLVVASFVADGNPRAFGVVTPVTTVQVNLFVDSQRRRLTGRGR